MKKPRPIRKIILHCSDYDEEHSVKDIRKWHLMNGWDDIGYHYVIEGFDTSESKVGQISIGRPLSFAGAHCRDYNFDSIGICLVGKMNFSNRQFYSLSKLCTNLLFSFYLQSDDIYGHNYFNKNKTCPNFDVDEFKMRFMRGE